MEDKDLIETKYTVIQPDGTTRDEVVKWPQKPGYKAMAALIDPLVGGNLERVNVLDPNRRDKSEFTYTDMFVNDRHQGKLPANAKATEIYRANWLKANPKDKPDSLEMIYGTAILFHRRVWF
mgnify:FL=1